jgi:hypothetical protein
MLQKHVWSAYHTTISEKYHDHDAPEFGKWLLMSAMGQEGQRRKVSPPAMRSELDSTTAFAARVSHGLHRWVLRDEGLELTAYGEV